jgi:hypothetical protein
MYKPPIQHTGPVQALQFAAIAVPIFDSMLAVWTEALALIRNRPRAAQGFRVVVAPSQM